MKAIEFQTTPHSPDSIEIPVLFKDQLRSEQHVSVIVLIEDDTNDDAWEKVKTTQFFAGYTDEDAVYDDEL